MLVLLHIFMHVGGTNPNTDWPSPLFITAAKQALHDRPASITRLFFPPDVSSLHIRSDYSRLAAAWRSIRNDKPWQMTFSGSHRKWRMISSGLDWQGDRRWNSRAAVLGHIRNDTFWNIEGVLGCWDWTSLSRAALHGADGPRQWERGEVMTASV